MRCQKSEKRALAACREILNAALEHQNVQVVHATTAADLVCIYGAFSADSVCISADLL